MNKNFRVAYFSNPVLLFYGFFFFIFFSWLFSLKTSLFPALFFFSYCSASPGLSPWLGKRNWNFKIFIKTKLTPVCICWTPNSAVTFNSFQIRIATYLLDEKDHHYYVPLTKSCYTKCLIMILVMKEAC